MIFHYTGEYPTDPEGEAAMHGAWGGWYGSIGASIADPGGQGGDARTVTASGDSDSSGAISGYAVVEAESLEAAVEMAKSNPIVADDQGSVEVFQIIPMD